MHKETEGGRGEKLFPVVSSSVMKGTADPFQANASLKSITAAIVLSGKVIGIWFLNVSKVTYVQE